MPPSDSRTPHAGSLATAISAHVEFFNELGVEGWRPEPEWRRSPSPAAGQGAASPLPSAGRAHDAPVAVAAVTVDAADDRMTSPDSSGHVPAEPVKVFASAEQALAAVRAELGEDCSRCKLHALGRSRIVFGVGNPDADLMFVGEAPGADEDLQGEPFVGRAGQLLTKIIEAINLRRQDVYIANVIKCRPPGNRNPEPDEVEQCEPFLFRQIDIVKPKVVVALGKFAAQSLLRSTEPITRLRGREYKYRDAILMPTYHPAYLLRNPSAKRDVWNDMKRVREILAGA
jgi:uracil-DNA glycosylase family 4